MKLKKKDITVPDTSNPKRGDLERYSNDINSPDYLPHLDIWKNARASEFSSIINNGVGAPKINTANKKLLETQNLFTSASSMVLDLSKSSNAGAY